MCDDRLDIGDSRGGDDASTEAEQLLRIYLVTKLRNRSIQKLILISCTVENLVERWAPHATKAEKSPTMETTKCQIKFIYVFRDNKIKNKKIKSI